MFAALCLPLLAGCGGGSSSPENGASRRDRRVEQYVQQVEPIRLGVNQLLNGADPILTALHGHHISKQAAAARLSGLERRFAAFTVQIAAIQPADGRLRALHAGYAQTYILEDSYLSALVSGLAGGNLEHLPDTQAAQRAAIIRWRTGLTVLAAQSGAALPADLQQAGRGEIAPSPQGS